MTNITVTELYLKEIKRLPLEERLRLLALLAADLAELSLPKEAPARGSDEEIQAAHRRLERHFGASDLGYPTGIDNENIDRDLAQVP